MRSWKLALAVGLLSLGSTAQATLIDRGNGLIYDDVLDITWLQDANYCATNPTDAACVAAGADANGRMIWDEAVAWADQLVYQGFDDWRLASMSVAAGLPTGATDIPVICTGLNEQACRDNELGYMYYHNLSNLAGPVKIGTVTGVDGVELQNIQVFQWSGTEFASNPNLIAWDFFFFNGDQDIGPKGSDNRAAWAVRAGDVAAAPLPGTAVLMALGLLGLGAGRRLRRVT